MYRWCASIGQSKGQCPIKHGVLFALNFTLSRVDRNQPVTRNVTICGYTETQTELDLKLCAPRPGPLSSGFEKYYNQISLYYYGSFGLTIDERPTYVLPWRKCHCTYRFQGQKSRLSNEVYTLGLAQDTHLHLWLLASENRWNVLTQSQQRRWPSSQDKLQRFLSFS